MQIVTSVSMLIGILIMMLTISWQLTLVAILIVPVRAAAHPVHHPALQPYFIQQQVSLGQLNGHAERNVLGHTVIKAFGTERIGRDFQGDQ